jgi:ParB family chromosome partitioning protein
MELEFHRLATKYEALRISQPGFQARLITSLSAEGQLNPVLVVESEVEAEGYVLIDGYRRVSALRALGLDTVEAVVLPLGEPAALIFRHCQEVARPRSALEDGWLLRELREIHGMTQAELSRRLQRSESWVSRRLSLVRELPETVQETVRQGRLCDHAAMKYLVPLARAKRSDCEELGRNLAGQRVSSRQMERLYAAWKGQDADGRRRLVQSPLLFLKTAERLEGEPPEQGGDGLEALVADLEILGAVSGRARRRVRGMRERSASAGKVLGAWRAAASSFAALAETIEEVIDAGDGDARGGLAAAR